MNNRKYIFKRLLHQEKTSGGLKLINTTRRSDWKNQRSGLMHVILSRVRGRDVDCKQMQRTTWAGLPIDG